MTGAYTFKRWDPGTLPWSFDQLPRGHWTRAPRDVAHPDYIRSLFLSCPVCGQTAGLPHEVSAEGVVTPSVACPYQPCPMHLQPVYLENWSDGAKPAD
jgi:hypothetical protein